MIIIFMEGGAIYARYGKGKTLTSILEERSGLDVRETVARSIHYLNGYESYLYEKEIEYLLETLDVEEEPPF